MRSRVMLQNGSRGVPLLLRGKKLPGPSPEVCHAHQNFTPRANSVSPPTALDSYAVPTYPTENECLRVGTSARARAPSRRFDPNLTSAPRPAPAANHASDAEEAVAYPSPAPPSTPPMS